VEAAFASRLADLGEGGASPLLLHTAESPAEATLPRGRAELMAALRASVELGAPNEASLPGRPRRKRRRPECVRSFRPTSKRYVSAS
jgi:hypothetical protein